MAVVRFTIGLIFVVATSSTFAAPPENPPEVVADLRYGSALYHYYQGDYHNALLELMIAEKRGGIKGHGDRPRVMEGSFNLAYGMERRATEIFNEVLNTSSQPEIRDTAWYYVAKIRYLRGDWQAAEQALTKVSPAPPPGIAGELASLHLNLAIKQKNLDLARKLLLRATPDDADSRSELDSWLRSWLPYGYYNLGAAQSRAGNFAAAIPYYNHVAEMPLTSEEYLALYDKAMTSAGYTYLLNGQYPEAQAQLSRVRLSSPLSSQAMLGYGWAAARQNNFVEALSPWRQLTTQSLVDENVQEALIAVAFAYEQLGNKGLALKHFQQAEQRLGAEVIRIEKLISDFDNGKIFEALGVQPGAQFNRLSQVTNSPLTKSQETNNQATNKDAALRLAYLAELFARNSFQLKIQELRDLLAIRERMLQWQDTLVLYSGMLDQREMKRRLRVDFLTQQQLARQVAQMRSRRDQLAQDIDRIANHNDYLALATGAGTKLHERTRSVEKNIAILAAAGRDIDDYQEAHRRYAGILLWQASEVFSERLWKRRKNLAALDEQLLTLDATRIRVEQAVNSDKDLQPYRQRIATGQRRLAQQMPAIDSAIDSARQQLRGQALAVLQQQQEQLGYYLARSRLAVARLYDDARVERQ